MKRDYDSMYLEDIFNLYKGNKDSEIKDYLVNRYIHIVDSCALKYRDDGNCLVSYEDLYQEGTIALIEVIDRYLNDGYQVSLTARIYGKVDSYMSTYIKRNSNSKLVELDDNVIYNTQDEEFYDAYLGVLREDLGNVLKGISEGSDNNKIMVFDLLLYFFDDMSYGEIANLRNVPYEDIYNNIRRCLRLLRHGERRKRLEGYI